MEGREEKWAAHYGGDSYEEFLTTEELTRLGTIPGGGQLRKKEIEDTKVGSILETYDLGDEGDNAAWVRVKVEEIVPSSSPTEKRCTIVHEDKRKKTIDLSKLGFRLVRQEGSLTLPDSKNGSDVDDRVEELNSRNDGVMDGEDTTDTTSPKTLNSELKNRKLRIQDNGAGGDCFFRCLAACSGMNQSDHKQVRKNVVEYIRSNKTMFKGCSVGGEVEGGPEIKTLDQYLQYVGKVSILMYAQMVLYSLYLWQIESFIVRTLFQEGRHAGEIEVLAAANLYKRKIEVLNVINGRVGFVQTHSPTNVEPTNRESIVLVYNKKKTHWQRAVSEIEKGGHDMRRTRSMGQGTN